MSYEERKNKRQELARPILEAMKAWMETESVKYSPWAQAGKAVTYAYTRWDNNLAGNVIQPITPGRKNYLFCGNHETAVNMSVICSPPATCKAHDVNPRDYKSPIAPLENKMEQYSL